jgi:prepilin-type N-terminal cleavage/methylation domain-containing protein
MQRHRKSAQKGFTLIELMIVVAIIGILAAVAYSQFRDMLNSSKGTEAEINLDAIKKGAEIYEKANNVFPDRAEGQGEPTPAEACCTTAEKKCAAQPELWKPDDGSKTIWTDLNFALNSSHYFQYQYDSEDNGNKFTALAIGNVGCRGDDQTYTLVGDIDDKGRVTFTKTKP